MQDTNDIQNALLALTAAIQRLSTSFSLLIVLNDQQSLYAYLATGGMLIALKLLTSDRVHSGQPVAYPTPERGVPANPVRTHCKSLNVNQIYCSLRLTPLNSPAIEPGKCTQISRCAIR